MDDDRAFMRQYAAEIARALQEQEENGTRSTEDSTKELYRALCFDEPTMDGIPCVATAASALSRQLTTATATTTTKYALSNRLVNGIVYVCRQRTQQSSSSLPVTSESTEESNSSAPVSPRANGNATTTSLALAKLAFSILIQVPLECCVLLLNHDLKSLQKILGSYKGMTGDAIDSPGSQDPLLDSKVDRLVESMAAMNKYNTAETHTNQESREDEKNLEETGSLEEVWAAESDPSDYDFGEGDTETLNYMPQATDFVDVLDPMVLSQADASLTLPQARLAVVSLLQQVNYTILAPIFHLSKKQMEPYISQLTQLLLLLLKPPRSILLPDDESASSSHDTLLIPLWIHRDAAMQHPSHEKAFYVTSYLEALRALLAMEQAHSSQAGTRREQLCSASIVGLSALSSWCCSSAIPIQTTAEAILDSMNDLAYVVERAMESGYRNHLRQSLAPILDILVGIDYDGKKVGNAVIGGAPQILLSSGLLRQLLVLSMDTTDDLAKTTPPHFLDHSIWGLCVGYPTVVGKYVFRYPNFASIVRRYNHGTPSSQDYVLSILWNCFGFMSSGECPPQVVWKSKEKNGNYMTAASPPLTGDECKEVCQKSWTKLCHLMITSLEDSSSSSDQTKLDIVNDWQRLLKLLVNIPSVSATFHTLIEDNDTQLNNIRDSLAKSSSAVSVEDDLITTRNKHEKVDGEDEGEHDRKRRPMTSQQQLIATTRKVVKEYTLFFQGNNRSSSKTD